MLISVVVVAFAAGSASAQQRRGGFGFGGLTMSLSTVAANEAVQKDLGLSGDTSTKLRELGEDYNAARQKEFQNAGVDFQNLQNLSSDDRQALGVKMAAVTSKLETEFNPKVKAIVSASQCQRLEQIRLQSNLRNSGPSALMSPELESDLKFSDEQKKKLNELNVEFGRRQRELFSGGAGGGTQEAFSKLREDRTAKTLEVLTAEQKETLNKLRGPEFDVSQLSTGGRGRRNNN